MSSIDNTTEDQEAVASGAQDSAETIEEKPQIESKSSMEILSELFSTFDAEPPVLVKKERDDAAKKHKKSKKKHKHKDKKDKKHKKSKKRKRNKSDDSSSSDSEGIDLSDLIRTGITLQRLIKTEIKDGIKQEPNNENDFDLGNDNVKLIDSEAVKTLKTEPGELVESDMKESGQDNGGNKEESKANGRTKITIKSIKAISLLKSESKDHQHKKSHKRKKHDHDKQEEVASKRSRSNSKEASRKDRGRREDEKYHRTRDKSRSRSPRLKYDDYYDKYENHIKSRYKDVHTTHRGDKYRSDHKNKYDNRDYKAKDDFYRGRDDYRHRHDRRHEPKEKEGDFYRNFNEERRFKDRHKEHDRGRPSRSDDKETRFDKKKLLEIARKNAIQMMKSGQLTGAMNLGPQAQEKVIAAISGGGKTIEELTDFCKTLSKKEELGELSSVASEDESESEEEDMTIRHPFQIKEKSFVINIKNSVPLPTRTNQERASELRIQFPVSSGQHHRTTESEWVPVSPKKIEAPTKPAITAVTTPVVANTNIAPALLAIEAAPKAQPPPAVIPTQNMQILPVPPPATAVGPVPPPGPQLFPPASKQSEKEIASIVSKRLAAMRKLQENPNDSQAIMEMYNSQKGMNHWAESKLPFGQFTGTTGANILSQAQLASGYQAWARKDQLQTAAPVSGGMGMHLLQKMGWRPGEGLGKEKTGALEPLLLEVKLDKKGVIAKEECKKKNPAIKIPRQTVKTLEGKHPVSLLHEYASKRKLGAPEYRLDFECGPDHMKNFLFKVVLNGQEYKPNVASGNKKDAKAIAATICLQGLGLLPS